MDNFNIVAAEFSGLLAGGVLDQIGTFSGGSALSATVGPTATTQQAKELVVALVGLGAAQGIFTINSPFSEIYTDLGANATGQFAYKVVSVSATQSATWNWNASASFSTAIATFRGD